MKIEFFVPGQPRTKGSPHIGRKKNGHAFMAPDSKLSSDWQKQVRHEAHIATGGRIPFGDKVAVTVCAEFVLPRPQGHYGKYGVKESAPKHPASRPDLDKMLRSIKDGMRMVVYSDDGQVVRVNTVKRYADPGEGPGVRIAVMEPEAV